MPLSHPPGGWALRQVVVDVGMATGNPALQDVARKVEALRSWGVADWPADLTPLWDWLRASFADGTLRAKGRIAGSPTVVTIDPAILATAIPDYQNDRLVSPDLTLAGVRIFVASALAEKAAAAPKRRHGVSHVDDDQPLLQEMARMIEAREATGPNDAAVAVAEQALGRGSVDSKRKRLLKGFAGHFGKVVSSDHSDKD